MNWTAKFLCVSLALAVCTWTLSAVIQLWFATMQIFKLMALGMM